MSDGSPYPNGIRSSVMGRRYGPSAQVVWVNLQLTSCRLAATIVTVQADVALDTATMDFIVWDWKTGKICIVSHTHCPDRRERTSWSH